MNAISGGIGRSSSFIGHAPAGIVAQTGPACNRLP